MKHQRIEVTTTDGSAWLDRLTPRQMISIGDCLWSEQRKRMIQDMKDAEVESAERMKALQEHDAKRGMMSEIIHYAINLQGSLEIISEAAKGKNAENADGLPDNFEGTAEEAMHIALELIGAQLDIQQDDKPNKSKKK
jgi:hypothetical protein